MTDKREDESHNFLLYIVKRKAQFKDEAVTITFFKDITLSILSE